MRNVFTGLILVFATLPLASAQSPGDDLRQSFSAGFIYGIGAGTFTPDVSNAPGYNVAYGCRLRPWLGFDGGLDQILRPIGTFIQFNNGIQTFTNTRDQLYLAPFGVRFAWSPANTRIRLSAGGGGAYLNHHFGQQTPYSYTNTSALGAQAVALIDYALTESGRLRIGLSARYYYVKENTEVTARIFTVGPEFTFSIR